MRINFVENLFPLAKQKYKTLINRLKKDFRCVDKFTQVSKPNEIERWRLEEGWWHTSIERNANVLFQAMWCT